MKAFFSNKKKQKRLREQITPLSANHIFFVIAPCLNFLAEYRLAASMSDNFLHKIMVYNKRGKTLCIFKISAEGKSYASCWLFIIFHNICKVYSNFSLNIIQIRELRSLFLEVNKLTKLWINSTILWPLCSPRQWPHTNQIEVFFVQPVLR